MKKVIQKQTPNGVKEIVLDYETGTASIDGLPFRKVQYGVFYHPKKYEGLYFPETEISPGKKVLVTLPNAPQDFLEVVLKKREQEKQREEKEKIERIHQGFTLIYRQEVSNYDWPTLALDRWTAEPSEGYDYLKGLGLSDKDIRQVREPKVEKRTFKGWSEVELEDYIYELTPQDVQKLEQIAESRRKKEEDYWNEIERQGITILAVNQCWECGRMRIRGKITRNGIERMPKGEFMKALEALRESNKKAYEVASQGGKVPLASIGGQENFLDPKYRVEVVSREYDGC